MSTWIDPEEQARYSNGMKVLTLCYEFPPIGGGGAQVVAGLAKELVCAGHTVDVLTMGFGTLAAEALVDGVRVYRVPCGRKAAYHCTMPEAASYLMAAPAKLRSLLKQERYDLIHAHFILPDGILAWQAHRASGIPYLITAHGSDVAGYNPHRLQWAHKLLAPLWRRVVDAAACIVCPSGVLQVLVRRQSATAKTCVIPNGINTASFQAPAGVRRKQILAVTRMLKRKGIQYLLEALAGFSHGYAVHIVGDGPYLPILKAKAQREGVAVTFWGWMDNADPKLKELYETSQIFVFPSESENFPIVLLEAMAAGLAIITTQGTGCAEVVGEAGLLVPEKDAAAIAAALRQLIEQPNRCEALGQAARRRLEERFSRPAVAQQYLKVYKQAAGQGMQPA